MSETEHGGPQLAKSPSGTQRRFRSVAEIKRELFPRLPIGVVDNDSPGRQLAELFDHYVAHKPA